MNYDNNNIFAKILRGEIPCKKIYENEYILSFYDINPQKKIHALVITKGEYTDLDDFSSRASEKEISELIKGISFVAKKFMKMNLFLLFMMLIHKKRFMLLLFPKGNTWIWIIFPQRHHKKKSQV